MLKKERIKPKKEDLIEFSGEHLYYEIWMFFSACKLLKKTEAGTPLYNALLESAITHASILIEFFYDSSSFPDTARASDYLKYPRAWKRLLPSYEQYFEVIHSRRNKELAHLSYDRLKVAPENKRWSLSRITNHLKRLVHLFLDNADKELLHSKMYDLRKEMD